MAPIEARERAPVTTATETTAGAARADAAKEPLSALLLSKEPTHDVAAYAEIMVGTTLAAAESSSMLTY